MKRSMTNLKREQKDNDVYQYQYHHQPGTIAANASVNTTTLHRPTLSRGITISA